MTKAEEYHEAIMKTMLLEDEIYDLLPNHNDFHSDYYDNSIEIYNIEPADDLKKKLKDFGFSLAWFHPHEKKENAGYCNLPCPCFNLRNI